MSEITNAHFYRNNSILKEGRQICPNKQMIEEHSYEEISEKASKVPSSLGTYTTSTGRRKGRGVEKIAASILDLFIRNASNLSPKIEHLMAFFVRDEKKFVRRVLEGRSFKFCCLPAKEALVLFIIRNRDDLSTSAWPNSDPSQNPEFRSLKAALRKHFSNSLMREMHDFMIAAIFDHCSPEVYERLPNVRVKDDCNPDLALHKLRLLLLSPYFKGDLDSEETLRQQIEDLDRPAQQTPVLTTRVAMMT
jgi:hypothetical protein